MVAYLIFARPSESRWITESSPIWAPFAAAGVLATVNVWLDARLAAESIWWPTWLWALLNPIVNALEFNVGARVLFRKTGDFTQLFRLFCYASVGFEACVMMLNVLSLALPAQSWLPPVLGLLVSLYWLYVNGYLAKRNYSLGNGSAIVLTLAVLGFVLLMAAVGGYLGGRLALTGLWRPR